MSREPFEAMPDAVSYTHLDVYKRQALCTLCRTVWTASTARWTTSQRSLNSAAEWGYTSVRCALQAAPSAAFKGRRVVLSCLLYTSQNYIDAWQKMEFPRAFANTLFITAMSVFLIVLFGSMAGYALAVSYTHLWFVAAKVAASQAPSSNA